VPIACDDGPIVLAFTLRQWLGTGGLHGRCAPCRDREGPLPPGVLNRAENPVKCGGKPMKLVSMGEPK